MALNHRLTIVGADIHDNKLDVKVYVEGYVGAAVERTGTVEPLEIAYGSNEGELMPLVYGSQATVRFYCENDYEFFDLFATNARDCYIEILLNTSTKIFKGYIEPGKWSEPLIAPDYEVEFTAYDGLGLLKDEDFKDTGKTYYEGYKTPLEILQIILAKTGLSLPLNTKVNIRPSGASAVADALNQVAKDCFTYREMNCYEVLSAIFINCRIFQRLGEWYILSNDNFVLTSITAYHYAANGTASGTITFNPRISSFWYENEPQMNLISAIKQITIKQDFGLKANIIENPNFEAFESGNFDGWTPYGATVPEQRIYDSDGNKYVYLPGTEYNAAWTDPRSHGLVSNGYVVQQTINIPKISIDYGLMGQAGKSANIFVGISLVTSTTAYSVIAVLNNDRKTVDYVWNERATVQPLGCPPQVTHVKNIGPDSYFVDKAPVTAYRSSEVADNFKTVTFTLQEGIPADGTLFVYLYTANTNAPETIRGSCFRQVKIQLTDENEEELASGRELIIVNNERNNYVPDDLEVINGDVPAVANNLVIYNNGFKLNDGSGNATQLWKIDGNAATFTWAELMARLLSDELRLVKQCLNVRLAENTPAMAMAFTDATNPGHIFVEAGITYDFAMASMEGRYIEMVAPDPTGFTVYEKTDFTKPKAVTDSGSGSGGGGGVVLSTDEKVGMITPLFEIVNQPGYLSTDDFVQELDPVSGRAIIKKRATAEQSDWTQTNDTATDFVKNKPTVIQFTYFT